jgi:hypothetical protein
MNRSAGMPRHYGKPAPQVAEPASPMGPVARYSGPQPPSSSHQPLPSPSTIQRRPQFARE